MNNVIYTWDESRCHLYNWFDYFFVSVVNHNKFHVIFFKAEKREDFAKGSNHIAVSNFNLIIKSRITDSIIEMISNRMLHFPK
jgi:hypothetical protein